MDTHQRTGHGGMWTMWICIALFALLVLSYFWR